jgi:hypothetical protein
MYPERLNIISEITSQKVDFARLLDIKILLLQYYYRYKSYTKFKKDEEVIMKNLGASVPRGAQVTKTKVLEKGSGNFLGFLTSVMSLASKDESFLEGGVFCLAKNETGATFRCKIEDVVLVPEA